MLFSLDEDQYEVKYIGHNVYSACNYQTSPLNLTSRATIYEFIQSNPGTHLRNICESLSISIGSVQYHLDRLTECELIESEKESKYKRFFVSRRFTEFEKRLIAFLRKPNARLIVKYTSVEEGCSHQMLADLLGVSSQAVTWHVQRLTDEGIIDSWVQGYSTYYRVTEETQAAIDALQYKL
jgi:predicted transcriptional regulator